MRPLIAMLVLGWTLTAVAVPPPPDQDQQDQGQQQQQGQQDQQDQQDQEGQQCPRCNPHPQVYTCHVKMTDCYHRPLYTYWGRWTDPRSACQIALNLCLRDASMGYGGYGARCWIMGK